MIKKVNMKTVLNIQGENLFSFISLCSLHHLCDTDILIQKSDKEKEETGILIVYVKLGSLIILNSSVKRNLILQRGLNSIS